VLITGIKSRPVYDRLEIIERAHRHIVVAQGSGGAAAIRLLDGLRSQPRPVEIFYSRQSFSGRDHADDLRALGIGTVDLFEDNGALIAALAARLADADLGTVLYLAGSETFIGLAMQVASSHNMKGDEVLREHCGTFARRVMCVHCNAFNDDITHRLFECGSCGETLIVRDHYSRAWAAFMGVKADAETPGLLPDDEELEA
jgi:hypothetical protein